MGALKLHVEAVDPTMLNLLRRLMREDLLSSFFLVGGTALALRLGHRMSMDIDFFSDKAFSVQPVAEFLRDCYSIRSLETAENTVRGEVEGVKIDLMSHRYPMIEIPAALEGVRLAGLKDIAAMKLNAIANRGSKKDFFDYAELLNYFSREEMFSFFAEKYTDQNIWYVEKSLSYFEDAEQDPSPHDLKGRTWETVKQRILQSSRRGI
jgi:predicted nucleotidyltransferase component of viral defense system